MIGIQGSGKTTYSNILSSRYNIHIVSTDELRNELKNKEIEVFPLAYSRCASYLNKGIDVIYDATSISKGARKHFMDELVNLGVELEKTEIIAYYFEPALELFKERVRIRNENKNERYLPLEVLDEYAKRIEEPTKEEGFSKIIRIKKEDNNYKVLEEL